MITEFEQGKRYKFSKKAFIKSESEAGWNANICWAKDCLDKEVKVINSINGNIGICEISPEWCVEIKRKGKYKWMQLNI